MNNAEKSSDFKDDVFVKIDYKQKYYELLEDHKYLKKKYKILKKIINEFMDIDE